jgi:hypothetical protein
MNPIINVWSMILFLANDRGISKLSLWSCLYKNTKITKVQMSKYLGKPVYTGVRKYKADSLT